MAPFLLVLLAQTAAGPPPPASAQGLAWFAHTAGESQLHWAVPTLEKVLRLPPGSIEQHHVVVEHTLDALIRLDAHVDPDLLVAVSSTASVQARQMALILLARHPQSVEGAVLELFDLGLSYGASIGAANLLVDRASPGIATRFLRALSVEVKLEVKDPHHGYAFGTSIGCGGAMGYYGMGSSWPPRVSYTFLVGDDAFTSDELARGAELFASGPPNYSVSVRREGLRRDPARFTWDSEQALDYLAYLTGLSREQLDLEPSQSESIVWSDDDGAERVRSKVVELEQRVLGRYESLVNRLRNDGWTTHTFEEELDYSIVIEDRRAQPTIALPTFDNPHVL